MTKNSKNIFLLSVFALIAILLIVIAVQPGHFSVTRSATISAPAATIFTQVNNLHNWNKWSPWVKLDPNAKMSFEGSEEGKGAVTHWDGNREVGKGKMTIVESNAPDLIKLELEFLKPMEAINISEFTFKPNGDQTIVTWSMEGKKNFVAKAMGLVMNCEKMVGEQFEKGLANLKNVAESEKPAVVAAPAGETVPAIDAKETSEIKN